MRKQRKIHKRRSLFRWFTVSMAATAVKYGAIGAAFALFGILFYLMQYKSVMRQTDWSSSFDTERIPLEQIFEEDKLFHVDKYKLNDEVLTLKGHFNGTKASEMRSISIQGLSHLINQAKSLITTDDKLEELSFSKGYYFSVERKSKEVICSRLIAGDKDAIKKAENISETIPRTAISPEEYVKMASDCANFKTKRGYITDSLTQLEEDFHIAFSLLMFKDVEQSERLLRAIYRPQNLYCIHVDSKSSDDVYNAMVSISKCFDNVFIARKRYDVRWGTMTVLEPDLLCMEELWNKSTSWKYFINLTGQEFPLRTNYELVQILKAYNGANDLESTVEKANKDRWKGAGTPPHGITPVKGSVHIVASRAYVDYVLHDQRAFDFLNWTRKTKVPDETFFATLNHNPVLGVPGSYKGYPETETKDNIKPFVARFKNWGAGKYNWPCHGQRVRMVCVFGTGDLPLLASRKELFANKFYLHYHRHALDCMEELHFNHTRDEYYGKLAFDVRWYSKLGFVSNKV